MLNNGRMGLHKTQDEARIIIPSQLIGAAEAAAILSLDRSSLTRWIHSGKIQPLAQLDGPKGAYVFDRADVVSFVSEGSAA